MQIDLEELKRHYAMLSDEGLLEIEPADLTDAALACYEDELASRNLLEEAQSHTAVEHVDPTAQSATPIEDQSGIVGTFQYPSELAEGRDVLQQAGIPYTIHSENYQYQLVVPPAFREKAMQLLRQEVFDPEAEVDYENHFALLDDEELLAMHTAGLSTVARKHLRRELGKRELVHQELPPEENDSEPDAAAEPGLRMVGTFLSSEDAAAARELLTSGNVPCSLENESAEAWSGEGELRLMVPAEFYDQACDILEAGFGEAGSSQAG